MRKNIISASNVNLIVDNPYGVIDMVYVNVLNQDFKERTNICLSDDKIDQAEKFGLALVELGKKIILQANSGVEYIHPEGYHTFGRIKWHNHI